MSKNKGKIKTEALMNIIYREIFDILEDNTHHPSYRKYFDKVVDDIFGIEAVSTGLLMAHNQFKFIKKLINNPDTKPFCQLMLRKEDVKALRDLVHVAYDASQIANKPKKKVSTKDIKSYRYLIDLYAKGVKKLRKKYQVEYENTKKDFKDKYSNLDRIVGKSTYNPYNFYLNDDDDFFDDDNDESLESLISDDESEEEYDMNTGFDISDRPEEYMMPTGKNKSARSNYVLIDDDEEDEDSDEERDYTIPNEDFQRYTVSMFERILKMLDDNNPASTKFSASVIDNTDGNVQADYTINEPSEIIPEEDTSDQSEDASKDITEQVGTNDKEYSKMSTAELITVFNDQSNQNPDISQASASDADPNVNVTAQNSDIEDSEE